MFVEVEFGIDGWASGYFWGLVVALLVRVIARVWCDSIGRFGFSGVLDGL